MTSVCEDCGGFCKAFSVIVAVVKQWPWPTLKFKCVSFDFKFVKWARKFGEDIFEILKKWVPATTQIDSIFNSFKKQAKCAKSFLISLKYSVITGFQALTYWIPCYLYKTVFVQFIISKLKTAEQHGMSEILEPHSTLFAASDIPKKHGSIVVAMLHLNGQISLEQVEQILQTNLSKDSTSSEKFQCYPVKWVGYWFWKKDVLFNVKNHIFEMKYYGNTWNTRTISRLHQQLLSVNFPETRSPWNVTLIQQSIDHVSVTIVAVKFHQCFGEITEVFKNLFATLFATSENITIIHKSRFSVLNVFLTNMKLLMYISESEKHPWHIQSGQSESSPTFIRFSENITLDYLKSIARTAGNMSISAILIGTLMEAVAKFLCGNTEINRRSMEGLFLVKIIKHKSPFFFGIIDPAEISEENSAFANIRRLHDKISDESLQRFETMISLAAALIEPRKLSLFKAFHTSITIFEEELHNPFRFGDILCEDLSVSGAQILPANISSVAVSFNVFCYQENIRFSVQAKASLLNEMQCEKLIRLVEDEILNMWAWSTLPR